MGLPAGINALPRGAPLQLLHGRGPDVGEVVGAGRRDDGVPDDGAVGGLGALGGVGVGPLGRDVDEELLRVPGEEGGEVGVEGEADGGVLFLFGGVVVGAALVSGGALVFIVLFSWFFGVGVEGGVVLKKGMWRDGGWRRGDVHLVRLGNDLPAGSPRRYEVRQRDEERDDEGGRREQPEGVLDARERVVHRDARGTPLGSGFWEKKIRGRPLW